MAASTADMTDGLFDICFFNGPIKLSQFFRIIVKYLKGNHLHEKECEFMQGRKLEMKFDRPVALQVDGENTHLQEAVIEMVPGGLKLRVPRNRAR